MNLVKLITDQFSDETLGKLSGLLGTDSETASAATPAAVPALLTGLAGLASRGEGAKKLADTLSGIDPGTMGNLAHLLGGDTSSLMQRGTGLLSSLFGDSMINTAASAIGRYSGINVEMAKKLLAFLLPMVLGKVTAQWRSQGGTVGALTSLFADQKRNIADAVPAGFSLTDIPGLSSAGEAVRGATQSTRRAAETAGAATGSAASWIVPLAVLIVGGLLLWNFLKSRPAEKPVAEQSAKDAATTTVMKPVVPDPQAASREMAAMPDIARITDDVKGVLTSFTNDLGTIKDAASAEAALPKLQELKAKLDGLRAAWTKLPETAQPALRQLIDAQVGPLKQKAQETIAIPGISDRVKMLINEIVQLFTAMTMQQTSQPSATN